MPIRIQETTKESLVETSVPDIGAVLSHKFIMEFMEESLSECGYSIEEEIYRATSDGSIAQCTYKLGKGKLIAWTNSYLPGMRFKCGSGIYFKTGACLIQDKEAHLFRNVDVDVRVKNEIKDIIQGIEFTYAKSIKFLNSMKSLIINDIQQGALLGILFGSHKVLTSEQAAQIAKQIKTSEDITMSAFYNNVAMALQRTHPKSWVDNHRVVFDTILNYTDKYIYSKTDLQDVVENDVVDEVIVDPNQVNMLDQIQEIEKEQAAEIDETELVMPNQRHTEVVEEPVKEVVEVEKPTEPIIVETFTFNDDDDEGDLSFDL